MKNLLEAIKLTALQLLSVILMIIIAGIVVTPIALIVVTAAIFIGVELSKLGLDKFTWLAIIVVIFILISVYENYSNIKEKGRR